MGDLCVLYAIPRFYTGFVEVVDGVNIFTKAGSNKNGAMRVSADVMFWTCIQKITFRILFVTPGNLNSGVTPRSGYTAHFRGP